MTLNTPDKKACFAEGTLVHTQDGLRPIETIQVGDYVLSKPESGEGENEYKRVTQTFKHENRELYAVRYFIENHLAKDEEYLITTTAEHPFWVPSVMVKDVNKPFGEGVAKAYGSWVTVEEMFVNEENRMRGKRSDIILHYLSTYDGKEFKSFATPICLTTDDASGYTHDYTGQEFGALWQTGGIYTYGYHGETVDFRESPPVIIPNCAFGLNTKSVNKDKSTWKAGSVEYHTRGFQPKLGTVYNLEVEDNHTYFVGEHGVWVHNTCKDFLGALR